MTISSNDIYYANLLTIIEQQKSLELNIYRIHSLNKSEEIETYYTSMESSLMAHYDLNQDIFREKQLDLFIRLYDALDKEEEIFFNNLDVSNDLQNQEDLLISASILDKL
jgi:hypothetical protein